MGGSRNLVRSLVCFVQVIVADRSNSFNMGQACSAGSRIFVQAGVYDEFIKKLTLVAKGMKAGDLFDPTTTHGPQVSKTQFDVGSS
jgi:acyl-CoA reductase-like NAD-dependent aldehyde dehydrogenase